MYSVQTQYVALVSTIHRISLPSLNVIFIFIFFLSDQRSYYFVLVRKEEKNIKNKNKIENKKSHSGSGPFSEEPKKETGPTACPANQHRPTHSLWFCPLSLSSYLLFPRSLSPSSLSFPFSFFSSILLFFSIISPASFRLLHLSPIYSLVCVLFAEEYYPCVRV